MAKFVKKSDELELQVTGTHIQWKYKYSGTWNDLVPLSDISGDIGPRGYRGYQGPAFAPDAIGNYANISDYNSELEGFAYLAIDHEALYFKTTIGWSGPLPFIDYSIAKRTSRFQTYIHGGN